MKFKYNIEIEFCGTVSKIVVSDGKGKMLHIAMEYTSQEEMQNSIPQMSAYAIQELIRL